MSRQPPRKRSLSDSIWIGLCDGLGAIFRWLRATEPFFLLLDAALFLLLLGGIAYLAFLS